MSAEKSIYASENQLKKYRSIAIKVSLFYADFNSVTFVFGGVEFTGEKLQNYCKKLYSKGTLPSVVTSWLYKSWVNIKTNDFLCEGGFRNYRGYWFVQNEMKRKEASYLIKRFRLMQKEITERYERVVTLPDNPLNYNLN